MHTQQDSAALLDSLMGQNTPPPLSLSLPPRSLSLSLPPRPLSLPLKRDVFAHICGCVHNATLSATCFTYHLLQNCFVSKSYSQADNDGHISVQLERATLLLVHVCNLIERSNFVHMYICITEGRHKIQRLLARSLFECLVMLSDQKGFIKQTPGLVVGQVSYLMRL